MQLKACEWLFFVTSCCNWKRDIELQEKRSRMAQSLSSSHSFIYSARTIKFSLLLWLCSTPISSPKWIGGVSNLLTWSDPRSIVPSCIVQVL